MSRAIADWRRFLTGRYAAFRTLAISDAIAVAVTCEPTLPIYVSEHVLDEVAN